MKGCGTGSKAALNLYAMASFTCNWSTNYQEKKEVMQQKTGSSSS